MSGTNPLPAGQWVNMPSLGAGTLAPGNLAGLATGASNSRPLRGPPVAYTRQPYLGSPPQVVGITGLGAGSGAYVTNNGSDADQSQGLVALRVGLTPAATGTLSLTYPAGIPAFGYFYAADWASVSVTGGGGNNTTLTWTANRPLVSGELLLLAYQWTVSQ